MRRRYLKYVFVNLTLLGLAGVWSAAHGQGVVAGRVTDAKTGTGIPGVNIQVTRTVLGSSSNAAGAFIIRGVPYGATGLRISMLGYATQTARGIEVNPGDTAFVFIKLSEAPIEIDPVVVTASKWRQEADNTPATIEVLTARDIMKRSPIKIQDALETAAGVQIMQENVTIRGSDGFTRGIGSRVLVLLDDVPVMNSDFGAVNWFMISPADVERAEIVRGAGSALYGSSAMGGVINFMTRNPTPQSRTYIRTIFGVYGEPSEKRWDWTGRLLNFHRQDVTHSRQIGNLGLRLSAGRSQSTGYHENGEFKRYNLSGKVTYSFPNASRLTFFGNYMNDDSDVFVRWRGQRRALNVAESEKDKHQNQNGITLFTKYTLPISSRAALNFRLYYNRFLLGTQLTTEGTFSPALGLGGSVQGNYLPFSSVSLVYGADFKLDKVKADSMLYGQRNAVLVAPYAQAEWRFHPNFNLSLGGRFDRYEIFSDATAQFGQGRSYEHFSPKVGLNYHPFARTTLRASAANGFKFPIVAQLFLEFDSAGFTFRASPDLRSERSWTYEFGLRQKITSTWFFEVNGFYTDVDDLIEVVLSPSLEASFRNIESARITGLEFVTNGRWWNNRLGLKANFTYMNPRDLVQNQLLAYRQKFIAFVSPSVRLGPWELQVDYKYADAQKIYQLSAFPQLVPQKVVDARLFYYHKKHTFYFGVNNLGNYNYTLRDEILEEIRNFVAGYTVEF